VGFVVDKVALGQVFPRVLGFSPVNLIPLLRKGQKIIIFIIGLHNKPQDCGASVASAAEPFTTKKQGKQAAAEKLDFLPKRFQIYAGNLNVYTQTRR
jgi:hypothetical protein